MTRPKRLGSGLVSLLAHVEPELRERVREVAAERKLPVSAVITEALEAGLPRLETRTARRPPRVYPPRICRDCGVEYQPRRIDGSSPSARCERCAAEWRRQRRMAR